MDPEHIDAAETSASGLSTWAKRIVPLLVSLFILSYYFHDQDWDKLKKAAVDSNLWLAVMALLIPQLIHWVAETYLQERHMNWFHEPFSFRDLFWVKGAIYILSFVNTALGGGGLLVYIQAKAEITWRKLMGIVLFRIGLLLWGIAVIMVPATVAMHYYGYTEKAGINMYAWWGFIVFGVVYLVNGWMTWHHGTHFGLSKFVVRDRDSEFWTAFRVATKKQWFITWALTVPVLLISVLGLYFLARAFGIEIPFLQFMVVGPLMLLVMDLPIAFGNFGTATLAWMIFFGDFGDEDTIKALTLFLPFTRSAIRALIGMVSLNRAIKEINLLFRK